MNIETTTHLIIFLAVFIITAIVITKKKKNCSNSETEEIDIEEIQAEIFDAAEYRKEAKADRLKAKLELEEAKKIKKMAQSNLIEKLINLKEDENESK